MLLPIRRPVRPEPLPLREHAGAGPAARPAQVWLSVRTKRYRAAALAARKTSQPWRGRFMAARG
jgi:hypothetical protein